MILFRCDYAEGAHPEILKRLSETNFEQLDGYGCDPYTESAKRKILEACACPDGEVHLLVGGTQTNATVIAALLRDYEGAVAVQTAHINVHEAGAVEYTGHKVMTLPQHLGKMDPGELEAFLAACDADVNKDHMVWPGLVYISLSTEYGTLYTRAELAELQAIAHKYGLPLFIDGARLGYALASPAIDYTLADLKDLCDVFYIGGTKVGALCGEAVVFTDNLYGRIAANAIARAQEMIAVLKEKGIPFFLETPTNQQFVILENAYMEALAERVGFDIWEPYDATHTVVRFATSWATTPAQIMQLKDLL